MTLPPLLTAEQFSVGTGGRISAADPRLPALLDGASAAIRRHCGWHIAPVRSEVDQHLDGTGSPVLSLPTMWLVSIDAVAENRAALDVNSLEWSHLGEVRKPGRTPWTDRYGAITASYTHGFDSAPDVAEVVQQLVANAISSPLGATREQAGALAVSWASTAPGVAGGLSLLERDLMLLAGYRLAARA